MAAHRPEKLTIRTYQVGFGDCFLLTFHYGAIANRRVLIDFGTSAFPEGSSLTQLKVAKQIKEDCGGDGARLDVLVATHRHSDHISGFSGLAGGEIGSLEPRVVIQPWTEDPEADPNGNRANAGADVNRAALTPEQSFVNALWNISEVAGWVGREAEKDHLKKELGEERAMELQFLGEDGIKNKGAVKNLMTWAEARRGIYAHYGKRIRVARQLPGVTVHAWGPPTLQQSEAIRGQRSVDHDEFWHKQAAAGRLISGRARKLFPGAKTEDDPLYARWFREQISKLRAETLLRIVRALDGTLNNTSLILLFEVGEKAFLFPGDAQIENWSYALEQEEVLALLPKVKLYKVGHHGSLNATPRTSLWGRFDNLSTDENADRLETLLSTRAGKHGDDTEGTEVPRGLLVKALREQTELTNTQDFIAGQTHKDVEFEL